MEQSESIRLVKVATVVVELCCYLESLLDSPDCCDRSTANHLIGLKCEVNEAMGAGRWDNDWRHKNGTE